MGIPNTIDDRGISLIEITIAITVLAIGILGLLSAFPRGTATQRTLELETIANHLAQAKLESFAATAYDDIAAGVQESSVRLDPDPASAFYAFRRTTQVDLVDENLAPGGTDIGYKRITVHVAWPRPLGGTTATTTLVTLVAKR